jgi:hypothetical protein
MAGAGAPRGLPGERPPSGGGGGRGAASAGTGSTEPGDVVQHRHLLRAEPGHVPVVASATAAGRHRRRRPGPYRSETRGREPSLTGYREDLCVACDGPGHRAGTAAHVCASREGPRAARGRAGGGSRRESSCVRSVGGRECAVGGEPGGGRVRPCRLRTCSGTESSVPIAREEGNRSRRARGECGGRRPAAGCRGRATASVRRGSAYLGGGEQALTGTSSRRSPGTWHVAPVRENRGPDSTAGRRVPGPVRSVHRTPGTAGASRWLGSVQGVHSVLRRGRPLLHGGPAASTAVRPGPDRGEAAPQRGKTPRAGSWGCWASPAAPRGGRPAAWEPDGRGHPRRGTRRRLRRPRGRRGGRANAAGPAGGRPPASRGSQPGREPPGGRRVEPESPRRGARPAARRPRARRAG